MHARVIMDGEVFKEMDLDLPSLVEEYRLLRDCGFVMESGAARARAEDGVWWTQRIWHARDGSATVRFQVAD